MSAVAPAPPPPTIDVGGDELSARPRRSKGVLSFGWLSPGKGMVASLRTPADISPRKIDATFSRLRREEERRQQVTFSEVEPFDSASPRAGLHDQKRDELNVISHDGFVASSILHEVDARVARGAPSGEVRKAKQKYVMAVMAIRQERERRSSHAQNLERRLDEQENLSRIRLEGKTRFVRGLLRWKKRPRRSAMAVGAAYHAKDTA